MGNKKKVLLEDDEKTECQYRKDRKENDKTEKKGVKSNKKVNTHLKLMFTVLRILTKIVCLN